MEERERVIYDGKLCTVTERQGRRLRLRDPYGFDLGFVPQRKTERLPHDDERRTFRAPA